VVRDHRRRGEVAPAEFYYSLEEGVPERVALVVFRFLQRREFPGDQTVWFLLWRYSKYAEHLRKLVINPGFRGSIFLSFFFIFAVSASANFLTALGSCAFT
jgi:hypothetical protein